MFILKVLTGFIIMFGAIAVSIKIGILTGEAIYRIAERCLNKIKSNLSKTKEEDRAELVKALKIDWRETL